MPSYEQQPTSPHGEQWPPEVPPFRPPGPPKQPPAPPPVPPPTQPPLPGPSPILPSWEEPLTGDFERDVAGRLLDKRIVTVTGRLDEPTANRVGSQLILLGRTDRRAPITMHLSCSDSELGASLALADAVDLAVAPVEAVVHGTLRGPAVAVLCAATKKVAHRHALFVLSVPRTTGEGTATQLAGLAEQHERQVAQLARRISEATGQQAEIVEADLESGRLLSAEEARTYGLVEQTV